MPKEIFRFWRFCCYQKAEPARLGVTQICEGRGEGLPIRGQGSVDVFALATHSSFRAGRGGMAEPVPLALHEPGSLDRVLMHLI